MKTNRKETTEHGHWKRRVYLSLAMLLGWSAGCGVQDQEGIGGNGGDAGHRGETLIQEPSAEDSVVTHNPRWDPPEGLAQAIAPPSNATACTLGTQCPTGLCVDGFCCDSKCDNKCMACSAAKKGSGVDGICGSIKYDTDPDNDCSYGACDGKNQCKNYNGFSCTAAPQCLSNYCVDGVCCGNICMGACQACTAAKKGSGINGVCGSIAVNTDPDNECNPGECNGAAACNTTPQPTSANGVSCTSAAQCASGYCADGVCCESWCLGTCQACTAAKKGSGSDGTCGSIANDKDPDDECWGGACNGAGVCKQYNGVPCADKTQCLSNYCVDGFCCGNICTGMCYACSEAKKGQGYDGVCGPMISGRDPENECNPGECNGSGTCNQPQTPQANGTTCVSGGQCASGNCVDSVCCDTTCTETCKACSAAKKGSGANGTCGSIASETNPDNECNGGKCDGTGACRYYNGAPCTATSQCFSNYCADGVCCGNICNQTCYACSATKKGQGFDGSCGPIATTKDPDNECNPGECNGSGACNQSQTPLANGATCAAAVQCMSSNCVDGVCCDTACTGACQACSATKKGQGTSGTCGPIKYDTDPDEECYDGACSGSGTCQLYNGLACTQTAQCLSNYCVDSVCCGNICNTPCTACTFAKRGSGSDGQCGPIANNTDPDNECGLTCNGAGACFKAANGAACMSATDCTSGFCVDGYCCDTGCSGTCYACNVSGAEGVCSSVCSSYCAGTVGFPQGPISLSTVSLGTGQLTNDIAAADFNNDGNQDVVVGLQYYPLVVMLGQGNGSFGPPNQLGSNSEWYSVATGDFDGDGYVDIVAGMLGTYSVTVFRNQGNGTFSANGDYVTGPGSNTGYRHIIQVGDVNGDGKLDIAAIHTENGTVTLLLGQGNGTFPTQLTIAVPEQPTALAIGRFNADTIVDLAVTTYDSATSSYRVSLLMGQGGGAFGAAVHYPLGATALSLAAGDANGDGRLDLAAVGSDPSTSKKLYLLLNQGNGTFANASTYDVIATGQVIATNLNGDALADFVVGTVGLRTVEVFMGQANGTLAARVDYAPGDLAIGTAAADFDNDGDKDIVVTAWGTMSLLKNSGTGSLGQPLNTAPHFSVPSGEVRQVDINADGILDLMTVDLNGLTTQAMLGLGNGTFAAPVAQTLEASGVGTTGFVVRDINADGKADIVYCKQFPSRVCLVRLGQGNGTFGPSTSYATPSNTTANASLGTVTLGDFDGNGTVDMATSLFDTIPVSPWQNKYQEQVFVMYWLNNGSGVFGARTDFTVYDALVTSDGSTRRCPMTAGDFNGDGKSDLAIADQRIGTRILLNQGGNQFGFGGSLMVTSRLDTADFNNDGLLDLYGWQNWNYVSDLLVWLNNGAGTFTQTYNTPSPNAQNSVVTTDINGDGFPDLAYTIGDALVSVKLGQGNGTFGNALKYGAGLSPTWLTAGDWNGDGRNDLAISNADYTVSILLNTCLP